MSDAYADRPRRPLRETVCEIDRDILRLVMRRHNLIAKMAAPRGGHLAPQEEKLLREAWEAQVSRVSTDPRLSSRFFALMQEVEFLPRPEEGETKHTAFGLAPAQLPVRIHLPAIIDCMTTRAFLALAAAGGQEAFLTPTYMNDPIVDCLRMLNQMGAALTREKEGVRAARTAPVTTPDKVVYVGDSLFNFCLALGHYLGHPSRAKFNGASSLKMADLTALRHFAPAMGARIIPIVPKSDGFPIRIECSGMLPPAVAFPADVPSEVAMGIALAAPFYEAPIDLELSALPGKEEILEFVTPILQAIQADFSADGEILHMRPCEVHVPATPTVPAAISLASVLMAFAATLTGSVDLAGTWPDTMASAAFLKLFDQLGLAPRVDGGHIRLDCRKPFTLPEKGIELPSALPEEWLPLPVALTCVQALRDGSAPMPQGYEAGSGRWSIAESFVHACGLAVDAEGLVTPAPRREEARPAPEGGQAPAGEEDGMAREAAPDAGQAPEGSPADGAKGEAPARPATPLNPVWTAPTAAWAVGLALAACGRRKGMPGMRLNNPGILTTLYPGFWALYNALPEPKERGQEQDAPAPAKERRRIRTSAVAQLTPRDEDEL